MALAQVRPVSVAQDVRRPRASRLQVQPLPALPAQQSSLQPHRWLVSQELQDSLLSAASSVLRFPKAGKVDWEYFWFPIEPIRRVWTSLHPGLRADPPSASVHLPAAVTRGI